ncbi:MAG: hypothetical protein HYY05_03030 [Chloroflexi bacterium]|nr:hypothetical protein [Chloroflexota bacterium]
MTWFRKLLRLAPSAKLDLLGPPATCTPGDTLPVEVRLTPAEDVTPRQVRVELAGREDYYVEVEHRDRDGTTRSIERRTRVFQSVVQVVHEAGLLGKGVEQRWSASLQVPPDASVASKGKYVDVRWVLRAVVDVSGRGDVVSEQPIGVLAPAPAEVVRAEQTEPIDDGTITLDIPRPALAGGETVEGTLRIDASSLPQVRGIRVELVRSEYAVERKVDDVVARQAFSVGSPSYPFALVLPPGAPPSSLGGGNSRLLWLVRGVMDRPMRSDYQVQTYVQVHNAPPPVHTQSG